MLAGRTRYVLIGTAAAVAVAAGAALSVIVPMPLMRAAPNYESSDDYSWNKGPICWEIR